MAEKLNIVIPKEGEFGPAKLPFGVVTGEGVDNYDEDGKEYTVTIALGKKEAKWLKKEILEFWEENKPSSFTGDKPTNWDNIVRENEDGELRVYVKTQTHFGDKPNVIKMIDGKRNPLDPAEFGQFGGDTTGRVSVIVGIYTNGKGAKMKAGISMYLAGVKLLSFSPLGSSGLEGFGEEEGEELAGHDFGAEKSEKKDKKKKKKKKSKK